MVKFALVVGEKRGLDSLAKYMLGCESEYVITTHHHHHHLITFHISSLEWSATTSQSSSGRYVARYSRRWLHSTFSSKNEQSQQF